MFAPLGSVEVSKDISVTGGTTGTAHLSLVTDTLSQTSNCPEPLSMGMMSGGFALLGVVRLRARAKKA